MKDLTKGNIYKTFILFAIPMVLSGLLSQCYNVVNTIIAGKLLGDGALGAIGAIAPLDTFLNSIFWGYGMGVGVYTAHLFGAKEYYRMKCVIVNNFLMLSGIIALLDVAKRHNIKVLEDACQAVGGSYKGKRLGTIGDAGALSFNHFKIISAGEAGHSLQNQRKFLKEL